MLSYLYLAPPNKIHHSNEIVVHYLQVSLIPCIINVYRQPAWKLLLIYCHNMSHNICTALKIVSCHNASLVVSSGTGGRLWCHYSRHRWYQDNSRFPLNCFVLFCCASVSFSVISLIKWLIHWQSVNHMITICYSKIYLVFSSHCEAKKRETDSP